MYLLLIVWMLSEAKWPTAKNRWQLEMYLSIFQYTLAVLKTNVVTSREQSLKNIKSFLGTKFWLRTFLTHIYTDFVNFNTKTCDFH